MMTAWLEIAAGRGQQDQVAGVEMGLVEPLAEPARGGRADLAALTTSARAARLGPSRSTLSITDEVMLGVDIQVLPVVPGIRPRQVAIGADADTPDSEQDEDGDREIRLAAEEAVTARRGRLIDCSNARRGAPQGPVGDRAAATAGHCRR